MLIGKGGEPMFSLFDYLQGIVETMGIIALALSFSKVRIQWVKALLAAAIIAAVIICIRMLPFTLGFHLPISVLLVFLTVAKIFGVPLSRAFITVFASVLVLVALEMIVNEVALHFNIVQDTDILTNSSIWLAIGFLQAVLLNGLAIVIQSFYKPSAGGYSR